MHTVAAEINSSLKLNDVLKALLRNVIEEVNCKAASIRLLGPRKRRLHLMAAEGLSDRYLKKGEVWVEESPIDREVLQGRPAMIYDVQREVGFQYPEEAAREGIRSVLAVPLQVRDEIIGVLRAYSVQPHRFSEEEVQFLEAIADLGAVAIENARLHEALSEKYEAAREDWAGWYRFLTMG
jgi:GAF domain-containing protein